MKQIAFLRNISIFAATFVFSAPVFSASPVLEEALVLARQIHTDQCEQRNLRGQLLMAHQSHDQEKLDALGPRFESVNQRLKPSEDRLKILKSALGKTPGEQSAFDAAVREAGDCD